MKRGEGLQKSPNLFFLRKDAQCSEIMLKKICSSLIHPLTKNFILSNAKKKIHILD